MSNWYPEFSRIMVLIGDAGIVLGLYDQVFKIFRTKSAKDFTWTIIAALAFAEVCFLNYGIVLGEYPIIIIAVADIPAVIMAVIGYAKYGGGEAK